MSKPVKPEILSATPTTEEARAYVQASIAFVNDRISASTAVLEHTSDLDAAAAVLLEASQAFASAVQVNTAVAKTGSALIEETAALTALPSSLSALTAIIAAKREEAAVLASQMAELEAQAAALTAVPVVADVVPGVEGATVLDVVDVSVAAATTTTTVANPDGSTGIADVIDAAAAIAALGGQLPSADDLARVSASAGNLKTVDTIKAPGRKATIRAWGQTDRVAASTSLDDKTMLSVLAEVETNNSQGRHKAIIVESGVDPKHVLKANDGDFNHRAILDMSAQRKALAAQFLDGETTNAAFARMRESYNADDRVSAAAITSCLPVKIDFSSGQLLPQAGTPWLDGIYNSLGFTVSGATYPSGRYPDMTLDDIALAPGAANIDRLATKTGLNYDTKTCFELPRDCPAPILMTVEPRYTCVCWDMDSQWSWRERLEQRYELVSVVRDRIKEVRAINRSLAAAQKVSLSPSYTLLQTLAMNVPRRLEQMVGQQRRRPEVVRTRIGTHPLMLTHLWMELQQMPGFAIPNFAKNWNSAADIAPWLLQLCNAESMTVAMDDATLPGLPKTLLPAPGVGATDVVAPIQVPWLYVAAVDANIHLEGEGITFGSSIGDPMYSSQDILNNKRCTFAEYLEGYTTGPESDYWRSQLFLFPGTCGNGSYAPEALAAAVACGPIV